MLRFVYGQRGKKGRPPAVAGRPNARTTRVGGEWAFEVNFGPEEQVTKSGHRLKAPTSDLASIHGDIAVEGNVATATYNAHLFYDPDFTRGIYKIALEAIALFLGTDVARSSEFDWVRRATLERTTSAPRCLIGFGTTEFDTRSFSNRLYAPYRPEDGSGGLVVPIRLFNIEFTADCTPEQRFIEFMLRYRALAPAAHKWKILPWEQDPSIRDEA